jgi:hypothetical protein
MLYVVLLESVDGRIHLREAAPVIMAGKPMFIDKPAAGSLADVIAIYDLAKKRNVPCFSSSSRYAELCREIGRFFKSGNLPVTADETIEIFTFMTKASGKAARPSRWPACSRKRGRKRQRDLGTEEERKAWGTAVQITVRPVDESRCVGVAFRGVARAMEAAFGKDRARRGHAPAGLYQSLPTA